MSLQSLKFTRVQLVKKKVRGLTILEISLAVFLLSVVLLSFISIHKKKSIDAFERQCLERKWPWADMADQLLWRIQKWQTWGSLCLNQNFSPIEIETNGTVKFWDIETISPIVRPMQQSTVVAVPNGHEFLPGQSVILCDNEGVAISSIEQTHVSNGREAMIQLRETSGGEKRLFPVGGVLVGAKLVSLETDDLGASGEKLLYEAHSANERQPIVGGFEKFEVISKSDPLGGFVIDFEFSKGDCSLKQRVTLRPSRLDEQLGRWWARDQGLVLDPWDLPKEGS